MRPSKVFASLFATVLLSVSTRALALLQPQRICDPSDHCTGFNNTKITLQCNGSSGAVVILDYGQDVAGFPTFEVASTSEKEGLLEITYSETRAALNLYMGDGPLPMAAAMDSYRINRYMISGPRNHTNRLIQGGFRYQKLNVSTTGTVVLTNVGIIPAAAELPMLGAFECSDVDLTRIWSAGARTMQLNQISKNSLPDFWDVTPEGSVVDSLIPQVLSNVEVSGATGYDLEFEVNVIRGGFAFMVLGSTLNVGILISCDFDEGTISAHYGSTIMDPLLVSMALPPNVTSGDWSSVRSLVNLTEIDVWIADQKVLNFTQTSSFYGSFGLGASFGHAAIFRDINAQSLSGASLYSSNLTDPSFLPDFFMGTNPHDAIVDGSKRDRIAYTGDLDVEIGAIMASNHGESYIISTIDLLRSYQATPGFFIPTAKVQQQPYPAPLSIAVTGLIGYSWAFVSGMAQYFEVTGNVTFAKEGAGSITRMLDWSDSQVLPNGLFNLSESLFGGDWDYYDPAQSGVVTKFNVLYAYSLQQSIPLLTSAGVNTSAYSQRLESLRAAIDAQLWSDELGAYIMSFDLTTGLAQDANALAILAGVTSGRRNHTSQAVLATMARELFIPSGALAFSNGTLSAGWRQTVSPYTSSYHLRAAFEANDSSSALTLLKTLYASMADPAHTNYTGCIWEALNINGRPLFDASTSLCHGWGAGPTAELSRYVLGVQPVKPGFAEWQVKPQTLGLEWAHGRQPTPWGPIGVEWSVCNDSSWSMLVEAPPGTIGILRMWTLEITVRRL